MKELILYGTQGEFIVKRELNLKGDDFSVVFNLPIIAHLAGLSITEVKKEEDDNKN